MKNVNQKKCRKLPTILETNDTTVINAIISSLVTSSVTGFELTVIPISTGSVCVTTLTKKV